MRDDYLAAGFTEQQVAEFDTVETIELLAAALSKCGCRVDRVGNGRRLASLLVENYRWDLVLSIAEGISGRSREAQVPAVCELFEQPYVFSDPLTMSVCLDKAIAKRVVRDAGVLTAPFRVFDCEEQSLSDWSLYPAFVKPIAEGTGKGCERSSIVHDSLELHRTATSLVSQYHQPALIEAYLPGREFTVGIVGHGAQAAVIGVMEIALREASELGVYSYTSKEACETMVHYFRANDDVARAAGDCALSAYRALGCRDAARIDIRNDSSGRPAFIEANPIAGLHPTHSDLPMLAEQNGVSYIQLMGMILDQACGRYGLSRVSAGNLQRFVAEAL